MTKSNADNFFSKKGVNAMRHPLFSNTVSFYFINFSDYIIIMIILPFLTRTILPEGIGILGLAQALGIVCLLIMEYGFSLSATRDVAGSSDHDQLSLVVSRVMGVKVSLSIICIFICYKKI